ncbi:MAG: sugar ABC transporter permease [Candidatus Enteromonas sp.]|nr:sugar ABC transporter permease [Candidatus Enteromonas sp.]
MEKIINIDSAEIVREEPNKVKAKKRLSKKWRDYIFIFVMLLYPIAQFVFTWSFVNIKSVLLAFQEGSVYGYTWVGFDTISKVFYESFNSYRNTTGVSWLNDSAVIILNSVGFAFITIFISLPLSVLFSFFLSKKMPLANVFRVIFFLPNIIPVVALTFAFKMAYQPEVGYLYPLIKALGISEASLNTYPLSQLLVYGYCIWAGLGYNIILLSGAIGRIPKELLESAKIDNCGYFKEFIHVVIPMIWPTIVTLVILGMTNVLTLYLQPLFLTNGEGNTWTISLEIWESVSTSNPKALCEAAAKGLIFSAIWSPVIMLTRHFMSKPFSEVNY